jgi:hypothetical protein
LRIGILGGGAAGFFGAIACAEHCPHCEVTLLEKSTKLLSKVRISGGGRCNVTHAVFDNALLVQNYPRGSRELRGPFERFSAKDTVAWFERRGVKLKTEADGRMFPVTDDSETIAQCLLESAHNARVRVLTGLQKVELESLPEGGFHVHLPNEQTIYFDKILAATGGIPKMEQGAWLEKLGHTLVPPVPSLFTFNLKDHPLRDLQGVSIGDAAVSVPGTKLSQRGPLLVTHWGLSGPAVLKVSAWGARELAALDYRFTLHINWLGDMRQENTMNSLNRLKADVPRKTLAAHPEFGLPSRLWKWLLDYAQLPADLRWADASKKHLPALANALTQTQVEVEGKSTNKDEFVTAGGVSLREVNMKTMESRKVPGLFFAGEVLDIDAVTGGFNFQAAWTSGYIAGISMGTE